MSHRNIVIENFRNIGIDSPQKLLIDADLNKIGGLVVVIGENNVGKSNLLDALQVVSHKQLTTNDKPSFFDCNDKCPKISLEYKDIEIATQDKDDIQDFEGKTFALCFTQGSLNKSLENTDKESYRQSVQTEFDKELSNSSLFALWDKDEQDKRDEIRLILKESQKVYLCSCKKGKRLECFGVLKKDFGDIKNNDRAIELKCKIHIDLDKKFTQGDNADELKEYLKNRNGENENKNTKSFHLNYELDENGNKKVSHTFEVCKTFNKESIKWDIDTCLGYLESSFQDSVEHIEVRISNLSNELRRCYYSGDQEKIQTQIRQLEKVKGVILKVKKLREKFDKLEIGVSNLDTIKKYCEELNRVINECSGDKKYPIVNSKGFYTEDYIDVINKQFGFPAQPTIYFYKTEYLKNSDLITTPEDIEQSSFFAAFFDWLPDTDLKALKSAYENAKSRNTPDYYKKAGEKITKSIQKHINKRFNEFFYNDDSAEVYEFNMHCEESKISFGLNKNGETITLDTQSAGFKFYFNFFFNFLHTDGIKKGDIVLIDEAETHLSIPAQRNFRAFLKEFSEKNGITFIITTHSPFMLDVAHLDEVRILKTSDKDSKTTQVVNDFSICSSNNALFNIVKALGTEIIEFGRKKLIFVEGITDYHYLYAFKNLYEKEQGKSLNLVFLPIGGLGKWEDDEKRFKEQQEQIKKNLIDLAKALSQTSVLFIDSDRVGDKMKELEDDDLKIPTLREVWEENEAKAIEDLFEEADREQFKLDKKSNANARNFKNEILESCVQKKTKERFYKVLEYLESF